MKVEIIKKNKQITTDWSGGTTTELYIYPQEAQYAKRDFLFRISSAACMNVISTFTKLPGVRRTLMVLDGHIMLIHEGHHQAILQPFDQDSFSGDWESACIGKCTDFNLMLRENCRGAVNKCSLKLGEEKEISATLDMCGFYITDGLVEFNNGSADGGKRHKLEKGDFVMISLEKEENRKASMKSLSQLATLLQVDIEINNYEQYT